MIDGVLALRDGASPGVVEERLAGYVHQDRRLVARGGGMRRRIVPPFAAVAARVRRSLAVRLRRRRDAAVRVFREPVRHAGRDDRRAGEPTAPPTSRSRRRIAALGPRAQRLRSPPNAMRGCRASRSTSTPRGLVISLPEAGSFPPGRADLSPAVQACHARPRRARSATLPHAIRVEGHTDDVPIRTAVSRRTGSCRPRARRASCSS